jgi:hypothetical protein
MKAMYRALFVTIVFFIILGINSNAKAVDVTYEGYFRSRGNFHYNLDLDRATQAKIRAFTDLRFRLNPTFLLTDKFRVYTSLNFVDGYLGSNPHRYSAYANPAQAHNRLLDNSETETVIGAPGSTVSDSSTGGIYLADGSVETTGLSPIQLRRAWAELDFAYGTLKVGRMPHDLGLGIFANAGDNPDQEEGTTRDRIVFDTSFGPYYMRPGIGWLIEGAFDDSADDFMEYFFNFGRKSENQNLSMYISFNTQNKYTPSGFTSTSNLVTRGTSYWGFDFFAQNKFSNVTLDTEVALYSGKIMGRDLLAINAVARSTFDAKPFGITLEGGFSSGTSAEDMTAGNLRTVSFSRDYNVSLIVFEEALPGGSYTKSSTGTITSVPTAPHAGAISNAFYPRVRIDYDVAPFFKPAVNLITPFAAQLPSGVSGRFYGIEYDIMTFWPINRYFTGEFSFGHFLPGSFYDQVSASHSTVLVRAGMVAKF